MLLVQSAHAAPQPPPGYAWKISIDTHAIAQARQIAARPRDLPGYGTPKMWVTNAQWTQPGYVNKVGPSVLYCQGRFTDFSSFTFRGGWATRLDRGFGSPKPGIHPATAVWELTSSVLVLADAAQARSYFNIVNTWQTRYCLKSGMTIGNENYTSVRRVQPPAVADQQAEVCARKTLLSNPTKKLGAVVLFIQRGAVNIELHFEWSGTPIPTSLINSLAKKIAARAG